MSCSPKISVKLPTGKVVDFSTESLLTVKDLKAKLEETEEIPQQYQSLVHADDILEDAAYLADCNLNNSVIHLIACSTQKSNIVFVRGHLRHTIIVDVQPDQTIGLLKDKINESHNISLEDQEIVFNGCCLEDENTIDHYNIPHKAVLYLLPRRNRAMQILVRISATNKILQLKVKATDKISEIKAKIHQKEGSILPNEQLLIYEDELLKDRYTVCGYNIGHLSMLDLLIKGRKAAELIMNEREKEMQCKPSQQSVLSTVGVSAVRPELKVENIDIREVITSTASFHSYWKEIGKLLGIPESTLDKITLTHQTEPRHYYEMLRYWIATPRASWRMLADALKHPLVKRVDEVEEKHIQNQTESSCSVNSDQHANGLTDDQPFDQNYSKECLVDIFGAKVDWKVLGLLLGLSDDSLQNIEGKSSSVDECQKSMIDQWISTGQARWSTLLNALKGPLLCNIRQAHKLAKKYLGQKLINEEELPGTIPVDEEKIKEKELVIANVLQSYPKQTGKQPKGIIFIFGMSAEVEGVTVDVENVRKTFQDELNFAVFRDENMTCSELAAIIEAAAGYDYPFMCKYKCFYFAGHGGIDEQQRPFFKPIPNSENEIFLIRENVLCRFKNINGSHQFIFFFDCCLDSKASLVNSSQSFNLESPVRCLVAYATYKGYKAYGDKIEGGRFTNILCENLKEKTELGEVLGKTHEEVRKKSEESEDDKLQLPQFRSCCGPIYLKGIPDRFRDQVLVPEPDTSNILKQFHDDLLESLYLNKDDLISFSALLCIDGIISKKEKQRISHNSGTKEGASILLAALENRVDDCPDLVDKIFEKMEELSDKLIGLVTRMRGPKRASTNDNATRTTLELLNEAYDNTKKREMESKIKVVALQKKSLSDKELEDKVEKYGFHCRSCIDLFHSSAQCACCSTISEQTAD